MYLKKLEIQGFKSFASKVVFDLSDGITCFVGPNGCGKSNVVDAVKWGLGEQRVSSMRGDSMQDVIFKGSRGKPPMNFSEVSLHFDNSDGVLSVEYDDVVVTRRLFRSGDSEYQLNRTSCRLRDIKDLFLDTGIGVSSYSIMEQGNIDSILLANPLDRRLIFEEAAGISRFKARRKEAERKLERTQANLLRLGDIVDELESRIRSLKNQAGRARNYLKYAELLKSLKRDLFIHFFRVLTDEGNEIAALKSRSIEEEKRIRDDIDATGENRSSLENEMEFASEQLSSKKTGLAEVKVSLEETEGKIGYLENRISELQKESAEMMSRDSELVAAIEEKEKNRVEIEERLQRILKEEKEIGDENERVAESLELSSAKWIKAGNVLEGLESSGREFARREVDTKNKVIESEARLKGTHTELVRMAQRQNTLVDELSNVLFMLSQGESRLEEKERDREALLEKHRQGRDSANTAQEEYAGIQERFRKIESSIIKKESRIELLDSLIKRKEGVAKGVKSVLDEAREGAGFPFVKGMLADLLEVDVDHSAALEAALGEIAEAVVVENFEQARRVMEYVDEDDRGRVIILPLSEFEGDSSPAASGNGSLMQNVMCRDSGLTRAVEALLGCVHVIEQEELTVGGKSSEFRYVTLRGDKLEPSGVLFVGRERGEPGVISRRSELASLDREKEELKNQLAEIDVRLDEKKKAIEESAESNRLLWERIEKENEAVAAMKAEREKNRERWNRVRREYSLNAFDAFELERVVNSLKEKLRRLRDEMLGSRDEMMRLDAEVEAARVELLSSKEEKDNHEEKQRELAVKKIRLSERRDGIEKESRIFFRNVEETKDRLEELRSGRDRLTGMRSDMEERLAEMKERINAFLDKRSELSAAMAGMEEDLEEQRRGLEKSKEELLAMEKELESARQSAGELGLRERENQVRVETLVEKTAEELDIDLQKEFESSENSPDDDGRDWDKTETDIEELKGRLSRMGNVNLEAINELEEVEKRFSSLVLQRDDLTGSIRSLENLIAGLNRDSREKFVDTFETVRGHFNQIFRKLFQGGKADLKLGDGEDVLESGIEIIAGPPGKEVRNINLLSGGEKSLTAVGLLFALFKSRPSPFCILDEVDAALDEVNVERFCGLLGEFVDESQFIIVTHSKRTMSYCDSLYGITMHEDGISTWISLNLEDYEEKVA